MIFRTKYNNDKAYQLDFQMKIDTSNIAHKWEISVIWGISDNGCVIAGLYCNTI